MTEKVFFIEVPISREGTRAECTQNTARMLEQYLFMQANPLKTERARCAIRQAYTYWAPLQEQIWEFGDGGGREI